MYSIIVDSENPLQADLLAKLCQNSYSFYIEYGKLLVLKESDENSLKNIREIIQSYYSDDCINIKEIDVEDDYDDITIAYYQYKVEYMKEL